MYVCVYVSQDVMLISCDLLCRDKHVPFIVPATRGNIANGRINHSDVRSYSGLCLI